MFTYIDAERDTISCLFSLPYTTSAINDMSKSERLKNSIVTMSVRIQKTGENSDGGSAGRKARGDLMFPARKDKQKNGGIIFFEEDHRIFQQPSIH